MPAKTSLQDYRQQIDALDHKLLALLNERAKLSLAIGRLKKETKLPVHNPVREQEVIDRLAYLKQSPLNKEQIAEIYKVIFAISRNLQD